MKKYYLYEVIKLKTVSKYSDLVAIRCNKHKSNESVVLVKQTILDTRYTPGDVITKEDFNILNSRASAQIILSDSYINIPEALRWIYADSRRDWLRSNSPHFTPEIKSYIGSPRYDFKNLFISPRIIKQSDLIAIRLEQEKGYMLLKYRYDIHNVKEIIPPAEFKVLNNRASDQLIFNECYIDMNSI
jgi:hypothetical protein